jgi:hypothetical protein
VNSLCAASKALKAAASSWVGRGGGEGRAGFLKTSGLRGWVGLAFGAWLTFFVALAEGRVTFVTFLDLAGAFEVVRLATPARTFTFVLLVATFDAFRARAFPAGERLVAGFKRVDFPAKTRLRVDDVADE